MKKIKRALKHLFSDKYRLLRRYAIRPNDIVIDLGANIGEVSEYFLEKHARVYAYEPNPHVFPVLSARVKDYSRAQLFPHAVSNYNGRSKLYLHHNHKGAELDFSQASSLMAEKQNVSSDYVDVNVIDINDILAAHNHIRLLKIDIEGGEYDIMDSVLAHSEKIDYILLETHEKKYPEFQERGAALHAKIATSPHKHKICTDWI